MTGSGLTYQAYALLFVAYGKEYPELAEQLDNMQRRRLPDGWDADLPTFEPDAKGLAGLAKEQISGVAA